MSDYAVPTEKEHEVARALAEEAGLEYREAGAVAIEPHVVALVPASECQRLCAVPMSGSAGSLVVGVADPSPERLEEIRELMGPRTRFVVLSERTLDALLRSRMFNGGIRTVAPRETPVDPPVEPAVSVPRPERSHEAAAAPAPPMPPQPDERMVDAIVAALEERLRPLAPSSPSEPAPVAFAAFAEATPVGDAVAQIDGAVAAWSSLRATMQALHDELESTKRALRDAKEQLSVAHAENDQVQRRIDAQEAELTQSRALVAAARLRLQEAADALLPGPEPTDAESGLHRERSEEGSRF